MRLDQRIIPFEIKSADNDQGDGATFEGWGAAYLNLDNVGDILAPGACGLDITFTKAEGKIRDEHWETTGRITDARDEPSKGLFIKGAISATTSGMNQRILIKDRVINRLSIGYCILSREWLDSPEAVKTYWQTQGYTPTEDDLTNLGCFGGARLVKRAKVHEVSTTWRPANDLATITSVKSRGQHAGTRFDDHASRVLATVEEFLERAAQVKKIRTGDGRDLSTKSRALIGRLANLLEQTAGATEPPVPDQVDADLALYDSFLQLEARLNGAI